jgi:hypothetical protein
MDSGFRASSVRINLLNDHNLRHMVDSGFARLGAKASAFDC